MFYLLLPVFALYCNVIIQTFNPDHYAIISASHHDYMSFYNNDKNLYKAFFEKLKIEKYKKIIFVSENDKKIFLNEFPDLKEKALFCNNLIDYNKIIEKSKYIIYIRFESIV